MNDKLNSNLEIAYEMINGNRENKFMFNKIYPFTTENISGYIKEFDLDNKSLLTVGSSSDQVFNATLLNCKDETVVDICPFTKYYYYLKKAGLLALDYNDFLEFFCYRDYPIIYMYNLKCQHKNKYNEIRELLNYLDNESFMFWEELYNKYSGINIRTNIFSFDEDRKSILKKINLYLNNNDNYELLREKILNIDPVFINKDIFDLNITSKFDNIFLSNLAQYYNLDDYKLLLDKLDKNLKIDGKMLVSYLYHTTINSKYKDSYSDIYNLNETFRLLSNYVSDFISFEGLNGLCNNKLYNKHDSAIIYKKIRKR